MSQSKPTLRETYLKTQDSNPSQLGDPISLKAETSKTSPTPQGAGASSSSKVQEIKATAPAPTEGDFDSKTSSGNGSNDKGSANTRVGREKGALGNGGNGGHADGRMTLRERAMETVEENPSQLGDPISLKAEKADSAPTGGNRDAEGAGGVGRSKL